MAIIETIMNHDVLQIKSLTFLMFLGLFLLVYFLLQNTKLQKYIILPANLYFILIMSGKTGMLIALTVCTICYICGLLVDKYRKEKKALATLFEWIGIIAAVGSLLIFKYLLDTFKIAAFGLSDSFGGIVAAILMPVGFSYYSLALMAYLIDVKHKKCTAEKNIYDFYTFALFFPSLIEGPFNIYKKLAPQLKRNNYFDWNRFVSGLQRILWGYMCKCIIADKIGILVNGILGDQNAKGFLVLAAFSLYSFQLYADFGGGIDIIMGFCECMGVELIENFKSPLISVSVTDYWQRWHKSLGVIMEKYVYFPMVLSKWMRKLTKNIRKGTTKALVSSVLANFLVFILVGLWHGTGWNYVVYGLYQATFTSLAILLKSFYDKMKQVCRVNDESISFRIFTIVRTFLILIGGRVLIKASDLSSAKTLYERLFSEFNPWVLNDPSMLEYGLNLRDIFAIMIGILLLIIVDIMHERGFRFRAWINSKDIVFRYGIYMIALFSIIIFGEFSSEVVLIYGQY